MPLIRILEFDWLKCCRMYLQISEFIDKYDFILVNKPTNIFRREILDRFPSWRENSHWNDIFESFSTLSWLNQYNELSIHTSCTFVFMMRDYVLLISVIIKKHSDFERLDFFHSNAFKIQNLIIFQTESFPICYVRHLLVPNRFKYATKLTKIKH